jgi:hypothetical protein
MPAVVRKDDDQHIGHDGPDVPFHETYYASGSPNVFTNNDPTVRGNSTDKCLCGDPAVGCSSTVFANNIGVHRVGDATGGHGNWVPNAAKTGSPNVFADS